jgi:hypothetical protein
MQVVYREKITLQNLGLALVSTGPVIAKFVPNPENSGV